jgi:hypothetical protein
MRDSSRGGVPLGVELKNDVLPGSTMLLGRERERLER